MAKLGVRMAAMNDILLACTIGDIGWLKRGLETGISPNSMNKQVNSKVNLDYRSIIIELAISQLDLCSIVMDVYYVGFEMPPPGS